MSWVQVGPHKINTAAICYVEQDGDIVRVYFHGAWEGNPLDLHFDEAKAFWRHLKAEDVSVARDKGSTAVLPKFRSAGTYDVDGTDAAPARPKPPPPSSVARHDSQPHLHPKLADGHRSAEHRKH